MTREEAAKICQSIKFILDKEDYSEEVEEALNMAIAALKQLSLPKIIIRQGEQEPCEYKRTDKRTETHACDCISRKDAIDVVRQYCIDNQIEDGDYHANGIEYELNELPTAQLFTSEQIQTMQELEAAQVEKAYELGKADRPTDEEDQLKFYYVESLDDYWVGRRLDNFYYATWHGRFGFIWSHSKYLPWGEHIVDENTLWKEHTYPSEPKEIPFTEWIVGFTKKYFADRPTLTPEEFAEKMAGIAKNGDEERKHVAADSIMCELLKSLGFGEGVGIFEDMDKWYS